MQISLVAHQAIQKDGNMNTKNTCKTCMWFDTTMGNASFHGYCVKNRDTLQALWVNIETVEDWFCADYLRRKDK